MNKFLLTIKKALQYLEHIFKYIMYIFFYKLFLFFNKSKLKSPYSIPVYIISYNRLSYIKQMVNWLENKGHNNIIIIDNNSTYKPLLNYYKTISHDVIKLKKNYGHMVFFKSNKFFFKRNFNFFVLTDPDLTPINGCPSDYMEVFTNKIKGGFSYSKVGFSLKIDDIPDENIYKKTIVEWESRFYNNPIMTKGITMYKADIDTTFALYKPKIFWSSRLFYKAFRIGHPYQLYHLPWYVTEMNSEDENYVNTTRPDVTNWSGDFNDIELRKKYNLSDND